MAEPLEPASKRAGGGPLDAPRDGWGPDPHHSPARPGVLLTIVLVIATAGLVYELVMAAVASYVLGDSVRHFSLVIGVYLSALGVGAYGSRGITRRLASTFVDVELAAALVGGASAPLLFLAFAVTRSFELVLFSVVVIVGVLVGLELPLLMRILRRQLGFEELVAKALAVDYLGALIGSLAFSLALVPVLGLARSSLACGLLNALVAFASTWALPCESEDEERALGRARVRAAVVVLLLCLGLAQAGRVVELGEQALFRDPVVVAVDSPYQRIAITESERGFALYLNGNLQLASQDEHRYHEALVHPAMAVAAGRRRVLIGGGGDGMAAREVLRWPEVEAVTLVDLDPAMTELGCHDPRLAAVNGHALDHPKLEVVNADAMRWLADTREIADVIILDFPDPSSYGVGKLYSTRFYRLALEHLAAGGALVVQASSPMFARRSFWCIVETLESLGLAVRPYHVFVPSFGEWGFALATREPVALPSAPRIDGLRYLSEQTLGGLFALPADSKRVAAEVNRLDNQILVAYYRDEWQRWAE